MLHPAAQGPLALTVQVGDQVLVFDSSRQELCASALHVGKQPFAGLVDKGDVPEIDYRFRAGRAIADTPPKGAQLVNPRARQMAAQVPALAILGLRVRETKHHPSSAERKGIARTTRETFYYEAVANTKCPSGDEVWAGAEVG
jgi:hypothetical protein